MKCISLFRVSRAVSVAIYTDANRVLSAREYQHIIRMVEEDVRTAEADEQADALRIYPPASLEAICKAMRDAMGDEHGDWRAYAHAAGCALINMPASAIEARRAETQSGSVEDESAVAKPDAQKEGS